ncbi:acyl carrier protein [Streptacidiphilus sp. MAP12-33]|uniref:acyl carrier protein n=1 Tax=Streptacidiphilus sp. MAP12-33 TaxID=3156266 RepID=UPI0035156A85
MTQAAKARNEVTLRRWITERVALYLERDPAAISLSVPLATYGLDSVVALSLCGDIEEEYGVELEPTVAWDYPTVEALADHLGDQIAGSAAR